MKKIISLILMVVLTVAIPISVSAAPSPIATIPTSTKAIMSTKTTKIEPTIVPIVRTFPIAKDKIRFSWNSVTQAKKYEIYRATGNSRFVLIGTTTNTSYTEKNMKPGNYTYKVRAIINNSYKDSVIMTVSLMNTSISPKIKSKKINRTSIKVQIKKDVVGATGYQVKYSLKNLKKSKYLKNARVKILSGKKRSLIIKDLKPNKKYYIRIRSYQTIKGKRVYSKWSAIDIIK